MKSVAHKTHVCHTLSYTRTSFIHYFIFLDTDTPSHFTAFHPPLICSFVNVFTANSYIRTHTHIFAHVYISPPNHEHVLPSWRRLSWDILAGSQLFGDHSTSIRFYHTHARSESSRHHSKPRGRNLVIWVPFTPYYFIYFWRSSRSFFHFPLCSIYKWHPCTQGTVYQYPGPWH